MQFNLKGLHSVIEIYSIHSIRETKLFGYRDFHPDISLKFLSCLPFPTFRSWSSFVSSLSRNFINVTKSSVLSGIVVIFVTIASYCSQMLLLVARDLNTMSRRIILDSMLLRSHRNRFILLQFSSKRCIGTITILSMTSSVSILCFSIACDLGGR